jgi:hypothetical protein
MKDSLEPEQEIVNRRFRCVGAPKLGGNQVYPLGKSAVGQIIYSARRTTDAPEAETFLFGGLKGHFGCRKRTRLESNRDSNFCYN